MELQGKYATATVFTDIIEPQAVAQVIQMLNQPFTQGQRVRIMPDVHAGAGCTVGTTMTVTDKICPNLVGVDIGCGMMAVRCEVDGTLDPQQIDDVIRQYVPSGSAIHQYEKEPDCRLKDLKCAQYVNLSKAKRSLGTLGGGNHFIELNRSEDGSVWLVIHSGSRHLGLEVAKHYQRLAVQNLRTTDKNEERAVIERLKKEGRQKDIREEVKKLQPVYSSVPKDLCWLEGNAMQDYLHDIAIIQSFADCNRREMAAQILSHTNLRTIESFTTIHNYIDVKNMILRKGAVSAQAGEKLIIPINMRDGSLICIGKGNEDWNFSAPHGAGRLMSRSQAREQFSIGEYRKEMQNVFTTSVNMQTIDECPMAYKPIDAILDNIGDTADVIEIIEPIYNFKAHE